MILRSNIFNAFPRKACCVIFVLLISISFSFGGALAKSCKGGPDCLNCAEASHPHVPDTDAGKENHGCGPGQNDGSCGFESGRSQDEFQVIVSTVRPDNHESSGIFKAASDEFDPSYLSGEIISLFLSPDSGKITPIYLLHESLLC